MDKECVRIEALKFVFHLPIKITSAECAVEYAKTFEKYISSKTLGRPPKGGKKS